MTKEEFLSAYAKASDMPLVDLRQRYTAVPCDCGDTICDGWKIMNKDDAKKVAGELSGNFGNYLLDIGFRKQGLIKMTPEQILAIAASVDSSFAADVVPYYKDELLKFAELLLAAKAEEDQKGE